VPKKARRTHKRYPTVTLHPGTQAIARGSQPATRPQRSRAAPGPAPHAAPARNAQAPRGLAASRPALNPPSLWRTDPGEPTYGRWQRLRWLLNATREMLDLYCKDLFGRWK
jgi:hypothetical protein